MGRIAKQEDVVATPAVGNLCPERVLSDTDELQLFLPNASQPRADQRANRRDRSEIGRRLP